MCTCITALGLSTVVMEETSWGNMSESQSALLYTCTNGEWILSRYVCDGHKDCRDNSDEAGCMNGKE